MKNSHVSDAALGIAPPGNRIPAGWNRHVKEAIIQVFSLAQVAWAEAQGWAAEQCDRRFSLRTQIDRLEREVAQLREELRLKDARLERVPPKHRPHYRPIERLEILELRAARGWNLAATAKAFLVTTATIASWMRRLADEGEAGLLQFDDPITERPALGHGERQPRRPEASSRRHGREIDVPDMVRMGVVIVFSSRQHPVPMAGPQRPTARRLR